MGFFSIVKSSVQKSKSVQKPKTSFLGGKDRKPVSYRYNSGFNYVESQEESQKPKKPKTRFLGGRFSKDKPVSYRYNSGFNFNHGGVRELDLVLEASVKKVN